MNTKKLISIILIILTLVYCGIAAAIYDESSSVEISCFADTYAANWAKQKHADVTLLADSQEEQILRLETFAYDEDRGNCVIIGYNGVSETLVIPEEVDGLPVVAVMEEAFAACPGLKEVILPDSLEYFAPLHTEQYTVRAHIDSAAYGLLVLAEAEKINAENLKKDAEDAAAAAEEAAEACRKLEAELTAAEEAEETDVAVLEELQLAVEESRKQAEETADAAEQLQLEFAAIPEETFVSAPYEVLLDSEPVNFRCADIPFEYSENETGLTLTAYTGSSDAIVVPETVDGIPVTAISFPVAETTRSVMIPPAVAEITSPLVESRYDARFFVNIALALLGMVVGLIATHLAARKRKTAEQRFMGTSLIWTGLKYHVLLLAFAAAALAFAWSPLVQVLVGVVLMALAVIEVLAVSFAVQKVEAVGAAAKERVNAGK